MRLIRTVGLTLATAGLLAAVAAASALAAPPELGRCVATPGGEYAGSHCTRLASAPGRGKYEWTAGPGAKPKFEGTSAVSPLLEMPGLKISCSVATYNGEYTGAKTASVTVDLIGCLNAETHKKCQSNPVKEGEIEPPSPLEGELGLINIGGIQHVGLDLKRSPAIVVFTCGEPLEAPEVTGTLEGSVIGQINPVNTMREEFRLKYRAEGLTQVPESFEGGEKDTLTAKLVSGVTTTEVPAVLKDKLVEVLNEEPLEIKAK
jgi:hypothetical protein